jgi:glyoxylase-like metal-dependent hydrolase (beta-lactamase superfamily II)
MKAMKIITCLLASILFTFACRTSTERDSADTKEWTSIGSYRKAKSILDSGIFALGGLDKIKSIEDITVEYNGLRTMINQSRKPEGPWDKEPSIGKAHIDRKNNRIYSENANYFPGIGSYTASVRLVGIKGFGIDYQKNYHGTEAWEISGQASADHHMSMYSRWMPPLLALQAYDNNITLRFLGKSIRNGTVYNAISYLQPDKSFLVLLFDEKTNLLGGFETMRDDDVYGDATESVLFSGFRDFNGLKMPIKRTDFFNDEVARELSLTISINEPMDEKDFVLPPEHTMPLKTNEPYTRIKKLGDGVYMDQDMGGILIVEFEDFCIALDCPGDFSMSQSTMDAMREIFPAKPIKYVVTSHTHGDHGGGVRAYYHSGATLITTPGNVNFYKAIAKINQTIDPDSLSYSKRKPVIETFTDKKIISDGIQTLELYNIGKNLHTDEMTIAYLPKQKILWQADQFFIPYTGNHLNTAMPITIEFAKKLMQLKLTDFETIIDPHYTRIATKEDFIETLRKGGFNDFK